MDQEAKAPESILGVTPEDDHDEATAPDAGGNPAQPSIEETQELLRPGVVPVTIPGIEGEVFVRKLGFFSKTDLFKLLAGAVSDLLEAGESVNTILSQLDLSEDTINSLKQGTAGGDQTKQVEVILNLVVKFALRAPALLEDLLLIALQVKPEQAHLYKAAFHEPTFDDDTAFAILNAFIDLNGDAFADFFVGWRGLFEKASQIRLNQN